MSDTAITEILLEGWPRFKQGKVRDVFDLEDRLLVVASDRISAFDCVLPTGIPDKGAVLNQLSAWWFDRTRSLVPNHLITADSQAIRRLLPAAPDWLRGRAMLVHKAEALPVECVVRGYLVGSGWKDYQQTQAVGGIPLRAGYRMADRLDEPLFTPARKADTGHDENISFAEVEHALGAELARQLRHTSLALYEQAAAYAQTRGLIIADTKFEFGLRDGRLLLIDEALTPDSSRFWPAARYVPGQTPPSFDKQYVRDYLETLDWNKQPPAPPLPESVVARTREKYREAFRCLTGRDPADT